MGLELTEHKWCLKIAENKKLIVLIWQRASCSFWFNCYQRPSHNIILPTLSSWSLLKCQNFSCQLFSFKRRPMCVPWPCSTLFLPLTWPDQDGSARTDSLNTFIISAWSSLWTGNNTKQEKPHLHKRTLGNVHKTCSECHWDLLQSTAAPLMFDNYKLYFYSIKI